MAKVIDVVRQRVEVVTIELDEEELFVLKALTGNVPGTTVFRQVASRIWNAIEPLVSYDVGKAVDYINVRDGMQSLSGIK